MKDEIEARLFDDDEVEVLVLADLLARAAAEAIDRPGDEDMLDRSELQECILDAVNRALLAAVAEYLGRPEQQMNVQQWWHNPLMPDRGD